MHSAQTITFLEPKQYAFTNAEKPEISAAYFNEFSVGFGDAIERPNDGGDYFVVDDVGSRAAAMDCPIRVFSILLESIANAATHALVMLL